MKVKEILEVLKVPADELLTKLENVGIKADLETEISQDIIRKLGRVYRVDIRAPKVQRTASKSPSKPDTTEKKLEEEKEKKIVQEAKTRTDKKPSTKVQKQTGNKNVAEQKKQHQHTRPQQGKKPQAQTNKPATKAAKPIKKERATGDDFVQELELTRVYDDKYTDYEKEVKVYTRLKNVKRKTKRGNRQTNVPVSEKARAQEIIFTPGITVAQLADGLNIAIGELVRKLVMLGYMVSASQALDRDVVEIISDEYGFTVKDKVVEDITKFEEIKIEDDEASLVNRPPIVTIMGHVDHGKTTLLDTIRHSRVASGEAGGITQHIGAYQVKRNDKLITFIDTPGHSAFTEMRARGANATDIVILVVAADDGVMPQTKEAMDHAKAAKVPIIVAINKMDKPQANPDRVKQELGNLGLVPEEWGGSTIYVPISALTGKGVDDLLEMVVLTSEMEDLKANPNRLGVGTVIEAKLDKGKGPVATLLVRNGTIRIGDPIVVGNTFGKIRAMHDEKNDMLTSAGPSKAVEITGLDSVPLAGDHFMVFEDEKTARLIAEERAQRTFNLEMGVGVPVSLANIFDNMSDDNKELNLIIKGDVHGSIEAIKSSLEKLEVEGVKINIVRSGVGAINENDINLAVASNSIIIAFNVRPIANILDYAKERSIEIRMYNIIYKVLEDIEAAMKGMLDPVFEEKMLGQAEVRNIFKASRIGTIAGCYVTNGTILRNSEVRLIRDSIVVYEGKLSSLKRFQDDVREVKSGFECGMTIENYNDIKTGDIIEAYTMVKVKQV